MKNRETAWIAPKKNMENGEEYKELNMKSGLDERGLKVCKYIKEEQWKR